MSISDFCTRYPSAVQDAVEEVLEEAVREALAEADEAADSSSAKAESHSKEMSGSSQELRLQPHAVEHMVAGNAMQADDINSARSNGMDKVLPQACLAITKPHLAANCFGSVCLPNDHRRCIMYHANVASCQFVTFAWSSQPCDF